MLLKILISLLLLVILASLFIALYKLLNHKPTDNKNCVENDNSNTVRALTYRIFFSVLLFIILMVGFYFGLFPA